MRRLFSTVLLVLGIACASTPPPPKEAPAPVAQVAEAPPAPEESWRAQPPQPGEPPDLVTPRFQRAVLKNGLVVLVSERHELPLVSLNVAFAAGSAAESEAQAGLAELTYKLLLEGAGDRDALALDNAFAELGASPAVAVKADGALVGVRVLQRNAEPALALLADVVRRPRLAPADFQRKRGEHLADLALQAGNPSFLSRQALAAEVFGSKHPYGHLPSGTPKTVASLTPRHVRTFYTRNFGPKAAALIITGDVTLEQAVAWGEKFFGSWKGTAVPPPVPPALEAAVRSNVVLVPKPGLNQTLIAFGRPAVRSGSEEEVPLELATAIFGGFFGSRLNMNLREDKGYSYGATANIDPRRGVGPLVAASAVRADVTGPSLKEFVSELEAMKARPISEAELATAREGLLRSMPGMFDSVEDLAAAAASLYWEDLPLDRFQRVAAALESAKLPQVQAAADKYFDAQRLKLVMVGDPDAIQAQVGALGLGEIRLRAPEPPRPPRPAKAPVTSSVSSGAR